MDVKNVDISELKPYYNNPRNNKKSIDDVAKSIKKFGWQQPIVVDKDMVIIVGHTRYLAAKKLKLKEVPVHIAKELTENEAKAYRIADNKTAEISSWDYDKLNSEIDEAIAGTTDDFELRNMKIDNGGVDLDSLDDIVSDEGQTQTKRYLKISVTDESKRNFIFKEICKIALKLELEVKFKGKVVLFFNDVMDNPRNDMRDEFVHVNRPIYLANPIEPEIAVQSVINFNVIDAVQMNQSWTIGKKLVAKKDETEPLFDLAYGGRNRPGVLKELKEIFSEVKSGVVFNGVVKELKGGAIKELNITKKVDNSLFREMISLGRYTVIPYEKKKDYVTSRMFETMTSNAITLFNKKEAKVEGLVLPELQYETPQEAVEIINGKYNEELLEEQHEAVRKFDFDKHIEQEAEAFRKMSTE